jgi:hypothetical protein
MSRASLGCPAAQMPRDDVCVHAEHRPRTCQLGRQTFRDHGRRTRVPAGGDHRDGPAAAELRLRPVHREQPVDKQPGNRAQHRRVLLDQHLE